MTRSQFINSYISVLWNISSFFVMLIAATNILVHVPSSILVRVPLMDVSRVNLLQYHFNLYFHKLSVRSTIFNTCNVGHLNFCQSNYKNGVFFVVFHCPLVEMKIYAYIYQNTLIPFFIKCLFMSSFLIRVPFFTLFFLLFQYVLTIIFSQFKKVSLN